MFYEFLNIIPENATEFLRYVVYKATQRTLLIKDKATIALLKECNRTPILGLFVKYRQAYGLKPLAEIFNRFKPLFLALKSDGRLNCIINTISKLSKTFHKPLPEDYLNSVTNKVSQNILSEPTLKKALASANVFRKIRLAYALKFRTKEGGSILYKIRNGKGWAEGFEYKNPEGAKETLDLVLDSIGEDIKKNVKGKKFYLPENVHYTLPATEKQFSGFFPSGSYVDIKDNIIVGVYWENVKTHRIDLDLSVMSLGTKIGWNAFYRTDGGGVLFSGDMTDASKGATECIYLAKNEPGAWLLALNYFNHDPSIPVPIKLFVASEKPVRFGRNYTVNPNNVIVSCKDEMKEERQKTLGLLVSTVEGCRFYFSATGLGNTISSYNTNFIEHARKYLVDYNVNSITLKEVLKKAGAKFVEDKKNADVDLSPEALEKDTILKLLI